MFHGSIPALITPFKDGEVDFDTYSTFIEWQIDQGSHAVVPCGTTGESPTLTHDEHKAVIEHCIEVVGGRIPVIAGTGSNSTHEAIDMTAHAKSAGADAALIITPYYNKPSQEGLYQHYKAIHDAVSIPIIVYNVPGRCVIDLSVETMARLAKLPNIVGVKDATNDLGRPIQTREKCGADFCQLSGEDGTIAAFLAHGGHGVISVVANIAPALMSALYESWVAGDLDSFAKIRDRLAPLSRDLFCETNPTPVKYAAEKLGLCRGEVRLPLVEISDTSKAKVDAALKYAGLI